jgi:alpha-mannosidase/mannosylglycerate hydrolase
MPASTSTVTRPAYYVLSSHWDREWYEPFQYYRYRLVQLMDRLIDGFDAGRLKGPFTADGQAIIMEDYLEIRPENREKVATLAREGKINIGPWYVLPDEFLVSGESMVRNIRLGREIARSFGVQPSNAGFVCDLFGHVSQLPQILHGFGIDNALLWRGHNLHERRHIKWSGADGSEVFCYKFSHIGYGDYAAHVRFAIKQSVPFDVNETETRISNFLAREIEATETDAILLFDGCDHQEWDQPHYEVLAKRFGNDRDGIRIEHSTLDAYMNAIRPQVDRITEKWHGEMREPARYPGISGHQIHGVLSSRVWIKQQNAHCQDLLCLWAEPFTAFSKRGLGGNDHEGFLATAWKHLLQNHPHDSICGCSIDQVHEDMKFRFSQARQIGERVTLAALQPIASTIEGDVADDEIRMVVFNPLSRPYSGTVEMAVPTPLDWPFWGEFFFFESKPAFVIHNAAGEVVPYQRVAQKADTKRTRIRPWHFPEEFKVNEVTVSLPVEIPAMGWTTLTVKKGQPGHPTRYSEAQSLVASERALENEIVRIEVGTSGQLTLTDKRTGQIYERLLTFEDIADIGDGWFHGQAVNDECHTTAAAGADVSIAHRGPHMSALRIRTKWELPARFDFQKMTRSQERRVVEMETLVRLRPGTDLVEFETTIHNTAEDHRVRVLFPSGAANAMTYLADSAFDTVERTIALRADNHEFVELEVETRPQQTWSAVHDKQRGLAVLSTGQLESAVIDNADRTLALTLFRSTRRTVMTDGQPEGLLLGKLSFHYAIKPLQGAPDQTELYTAGQRIASGFQVLSVQPADQELNRQKGKSLPASASFISATGDAIVTSCRRVGNGMEVRLFNPHAREIDFSLSWRGAPQGFAGFKSAQPVDFESKPAGKALPVQDHGVKAKLGAKKILTLALT